MNLTTREVLVFGLVVVVVLFGGLLLYGLYASLQGVGLGGMGPGMMGPGMMDGFNIFGWLLPCLIPAGLLILLVAALAWLLAAIRHSGQRSDSSTEAHCPNCSRSVQSDWQVCPYCGTSLGEEQQA
jgi:hypothetical protein